jgi:hypothetical protein
MRVWIFFLIAYGASAQESVDGLNWLAGCWDGSTEKQERVEQWMKPSGNMMMGMSRTVRNGQIREYEFLRIHQRDGAIYYTANPSGQREASFRLIRLTEQEAIFENAEHDFPQRIGYRLESGGMLTAWIEGTINGKDKKIDFPFRKTDCP